jgi:hypothetical protein
LFHRRVGDSSIVDRDDRGKQLPSDSGSFDLSKRGATEVAAELAARMTHWRQARKRQDAAKGTPSAGAGASGARPAKIDPVSMAREQDPARVARLHRALRIAAQAKALHTEAMRTTPAHTPAAYGTAFRDVLSPGRGGADAGTLHTAPQEPGGEPIARGAHDAGVRVRAPAIATWRARFATGLDRVLLRIGKFSSSIRNGIGLAWERGRTLGPTARRATADRLVLAGGIAIVLAAAVWLMQPHAPAPEQAASTPEQKPSPAVVAAAIAPSPAAPVRAAPPEPQPGPEAQVSATPPTPAAPLPLKSSPKLKPIAQAPVLIARLKPSVPEAAAPAATSPAPLNSRLVQPPVPLEAGPLRRQEQ